MEMEKELRKRKKRRKREKEKNLKEKLRLFSPNSRITSRPTVLVKTFEAHTRLVKR